MLSLEPQVSKNTEPDGSETEMPPKGQKSTSASTVSRSHKFRGKRHTMLADGRPNPPKYDKKNIKNIQSTSFKNRKLYAVKGKAK